MRVRSDTGLIDAIDTAFGARPPRRLGVAVSGGSDSLALLHLLHGWGKAEIAAVTVDHRLRPDSASEALHVAWICEGLGVSHDILEWRGWDGKGNLQAEARRTRFAMLAEWAQARGAEAVALGHTMDDQAETVLMRLAREAGVDGLSGMAPMVRRHGVTFRRPLLGQRREDLRALLERRGVRWVEDPSNADEGFERVRARAVLAALEPLGITVERLAGSALHLGGARDALAMAAAEFAREHARVVAGDVLFDRTRLNRLAPELHRRVLAGALRFVASAEYPPRREPMSAALAACTVPENVTLHGCRVLVSDMTVRVVREHAAVAALAGPTDAPWDSRWVLEGPHTPDLEVRALGEAVKDCPDWRGTGLPRATLLASPSVWRGETLVAAPVAGLHNGWVARAPGAADFAASLLAH